MLTLSTFRLRPVRAICLAFAVWKLFLLVIALSASLCQDYDTSTSLFLERLYGRAASKNGGESKVAYSSLATRLTRWDAIYYVHAAREGYVFEQEWAFGTGVALSIRYVSAGLRMLGIVSDITPGIEALVGIAISLSSHLLAAIILYYSTVLVTEGNRKLAFISSLLCIITPGGMFLLAPYGESPFSFLAFLGIYLIALSYKSAERGQVLQKNLFLVASASLFGLGSTFRSNGLSYGLLFAVEAIRTTLAFVRLPSTSSFFAVLGAGLSGLILAAGTIAPQFAAWLQYCTSPSPLDIRPWCGRKLPSIYTFVQDHYWDVGFLRYWTLNQVPLFLLAAPMLIILIFSGYEIVSRPSMILTTSAANRRGQTKTLVQTLAVMQIAVALLALTNYHVQIITRLSSGYVVWYWWIASCLCNKATESKGRSVVIFMVMYAGIQGGLFSSFLPPA